MTDAAKGFPPIAASGAQRVILGSMPGRISLAHHQYYANDRNAFWTIMERVCGAGPGHSYHERIEKLQAAGIAVWDVLSHCERAGSLDSAIDLRSARNNDFIAFFTTFHSITEVFFNGRKAEALFRRLVLPELRPLPKPLKLVGLPSTSPAYAAMPVADKLAHWLSALSVGNAHITKHP